MATVADIAIGKFVKVGKYNNADIVWECVVDDGANGKRLLSKYVLFTKQWDDASLHPSWINSTLRAYLTDTSVNGFLNPTDFNASELLSLIPITRNQLNTQQTQFEGNSTDLVRIPDFFEYYYYYTPNGLRDKTLINSNPASFWFNTVDVSNNNNTYNGTGTGLERASSVNSTIGVCPQINIIATTRIGSGTGDLATPYILTYAVSVTFDSVVGDCNAEGITVGVAKTSIPNITSIIGNCNADGLISEAEGLLIQSTYVTGVVGNCDAEGLTSIALQTDTISNVLYTFYSRSRIEFTAKLKLM